MGGLKVVALISGGKDSFFSILHCNANGDEVVALANLHPPLDNGERSEDIDSYMYQTIGHTVIPLYAEALDLPLYRQEILGGVVDQNKSYATPADQQDSSSQDETESLVPLLKKVMAAHPEINAVSTGAILSDYQRTRVESVAIRLGLVPLSYLWQYPFLPPYEETSLLDHMAAMGQDARIIKVASGGLDEGFLWENVASVKTKNRLVRAMERFGIVGDGAALGEGGEFETLAINGPRPLWKKRIEINESDRVAVAGEAGAASLKIRNARLVPNPEGSADTSYEQLEKPCFMDDKFDALDIKLNSLQLPEESQSSSQTVDYSVEVLNASTAWTVQNTDSCTIISNAMEQGSSAGEQMTSIMARLTQQHEVSPSTIAFTTILLRDMAQFGAVNTAYGSQFTAPLPPARVTVACGNTLPAGTDVSLSVVVLKDIVGANKQGLHVQSRSYWAPANIGPYSQAVVVPPQQTGLPSLVHIAGQIPLFPPTMEVTYRGDDESHLKHFRFQGVLALQHLWRIGQVMNVTHWLGAVAFIARKSEASAEGRVHNVLQTWKLAHESTEEVKDDEDEEDDDVDVWDRVHGQQQNSGSSSNTSTMRKDMVNKSVPPCFIAEVESLPRDVDIEWASTGVASYGGNVVTTEQGKDKHTIYELSLEATGIGNMSAGSWTMVPKVEDLKMVTLPDVETAGACTVYTMKALPKQWVEQRQPTVVPCYRLWAFDGKAVDVVVAYKRW